MPGPGGRARRGSPGFGGGSRPGTFPIDAILRAVERFNSLRSPEATAWLVGVGGEGRVLVRVSGPFCASCGLYDYFDDLALEIEDMLGEEVRPESVEEEGGDSFLVTLSIGRRGRDRAGGGEGEG